MHFRNTNLNTNNLMFSVPNGGTSAKEQMYKKALGMMSGVSDTIIVLSERIIFCEFKIDKGLQSDEQKKFEAKVKALGFEYIVVRSLDDFKLKLDL